MGPVIGSPGEGAAFLARVNLPETCVRRTVRVGGRHGLELVEELKSAGVAINDLGMQLLASSKFIVPGCEFSVDTVELTVRDLGFPRGGDGRIWWPDLQPPVFRSVRWIWLPACACSIPTCPKSRTDPLPAKRLLPVR